MFLCNVIKLKLSLFIIGLSIFIINNFHFTKALNELNNKNETTKISNDKNKDYNQNRFEFEHNMVFYLKNSLYDPIKIERNQLIKQLLKKATTKRRTTKRRFKKTTRRTTKKRRSSTTPVRNIPDPNEVINQDQIEPLTTKIIATTHTTDTSEIINNINSMFECGNPIINPSINGSNLNIERIMFGEDANSNSWPWLVSIRESLGSRYYHVCAGSLISNLHIVTASHCVYDYAKDDYMVVIGTHNLTETLTPEKIFYVAKITKHPLYDSKFLFNDITILELSRAVEFTSKISPICIPKSSDYKLIFDKNVVVIGWGSTDGIKSISSLSNILQQTILQITTNETICRGFNARNYCGLDTNVKLSNICFGDSGGSLMYSIDGKWHLYGISSFVLANAYGKCLNFQPSFYTIVPNYVDWIRSFNIL